MLQIASGKYFRAGVQLNETLHRFTFFTNASRASREPVVLPIATLRFSTSIEPFGAVTVEVVDRLEAQRPDGTSEFLIATAGDDLASDVAVVLAFVLNTTWSTDHDLMRRLVQGESLDHPRRGPRSQLRGTFDPQVLITDGAVADAADFFAQLLALHRKEYEKAIRAIRRVVDATLLIPSDVSLAYTLFVAALESLAADTAAVASAWDQLDGRKRSLINAALTGLTDEQVERVQTAVLAADALALGRKFQTFTLDHIAPSYYREEAEQAQRPIPAHELPHALRFAYQVRSRQVHALERLAPEIWVMTDRSETVHVEGRTVLSLEGLNRLCRHVIRRFVERASTDHDDTFDYRSSLPGIVHMQLAPQYWIHHADGLQAKRVPVVLNGFLEVLLPVLREEESAQVVDMRGVLERIESLLPGEALASARAPMVALYALWHRLMTPDVHRPNAETVIDRFVDDLGEPGVAAFATAAILRDEMPWPTAAMAAFAKERAQQLRGGKAQPLPAVLDAALELHVARLLQREDRGEEALAALGRAIEILPGDQRLMDLEDEVRAGHVGGENLSTLDVRALLLQARKTPDGPKDAEPDPADRGGAGNSADLHDSCNPDAPPNPSGPSC